MSYVSNDVIREIRSGRISQGVLYESRNGYNFKGDKNSLPLYYFRSDDGTIPAKALYEIISVELMYVLVVTHDKSYLCYMNGGFTSRSMYMYNKIESINFIKDSGERLAALESYLYNVKHIYKNYATYKNIFEALSDEMLSADAVFQDGDDQEYSLLIGKIKRRVRDHNSIFLMLNDCYVINKNKKNARVLLKHIYHLVKDLIKDIREKTKALDIYNYNRLFQIYLNYVGYGIVAFDSDRDVLIHLSIKEKVLMQKPITFQYLNLGGR